VEIGVRVRGVVRGMRQTGPHAAEINLLGELEVRLGGRPLQLPASKKTRALLAYLVVTGRPHLRERLCALLWDGPDDPRAALRWSLSKLRPLLDGGGGSLVADRERAGFVPGGVAVDVTAVRTLLAAGPAATPTDVLRDATARFRGELLEGLDLPGCYSYHAWCVSERELLRTLRLAALGALVGRLSRGDGDPGDLEEALVVARARVAIDPLAEAAHVDVVRILGRLGRVREAQAQVESCRRILETELGARASEALEQARRELTAQPTAQGTPLVLAGAPPGPRQSVLAVPAVLAAPAAPPGTREISFPAPEGSHPGARPPLVGRDAPRETIAAAVERAAAGRSGPALLFVGDPGIGKTRLLDLVCDEVGAARGTVLRGRAFEAEMVRPYGPWLDALGAVAPPPGIDLGPLAPLLGPGGSRGIQPTSSVDRAQLFDAFVHVLGAWSAAAGVLALILDDVQWLDEASAALLHFVGRAAPGGRVLTACAARAGELGDNASALRVVRALQRERRLEQHTLAPLGAAETAALVRAVHPDVDASEAFASSEGNPLFALELARSARAIATGDLLPGEATGLVGGTLDELLDERIARLEEGTRELLTWAAALGRSFDPDVLARVSGIAAPALLPALERLERHGMVRPAAGGYDFTHDLLRRAAYRRLSEPRRRLAHLEIARQLHRLGDGDDRFAGEVAHHAALGGDPALAAEAAVIAGRRCLRMFAFSEAAELCLRGLPHLPRLEHTTRIRLQLELYGVLVGSGQAEQRIPAIELELTRAILDAQDTGLHAEAARGFHTRSLLHFKRQNIEGARESSLRALAESDAAGVEERVRQLADSARCLMLLEREVPRAQALVEEARAMLAPRDGRSTNVAWALALLGRYTGDHAGAVPAFEEAIAGFRREHAHWEHCLALTQRVMLELERGDPGCAQRLCATLVEVAGRMAEGSEGASAAALTALADRARGVVGADHALEAAIAHLRMVDAKAMLAYVLNSAVAQDLAAGALDDLARTGARALARTDARAAAALAAAEPVRHLSESAVAHALLGGIAWRRGERASAEAHLALARRQSTTPLALSARAVAAVEGLARQLSGSR